MKQTIRTAMMLIMAIALCRDASAQALGTIAGSAQDNQGAVLPGVTVEVASPALIEKVRSATTDGTGLYRIVNLPPGTYTVTFTLTGFNTFKREGVSVSPGSACGARFATPRTETPRSSNQYAPSSSTRTMSRPSRSTALPEGTPKR